MESLFDPQGNQNILDRIDNLSPITLSQWGKMTVSQMLLHLQKPIDLAYGKLHIAPHWKSYFFAKSYRKKLNDPKEFIVTHEPKFEEAKQSLKESVAVFARDGHKAIKTTRHPLMGEMTPGEWDILQWKHLDYHLKQFGV
jgi:hypothetical protein